MNTTDFVGTVRRGAHVVAEKVSRYTEGKEEKAKKPEVMILPQEPWDDKTLAPILREHAKNAALTAAASGLLPGAGPTVAAMTSAGFVLAMLHKINESLGVKLPKSEIKPVADAIVHTVTPMAMAKYFAASGLSFIPVVGNVAAGAIMASVCHSIVYASGTVYLETLHTLCAQGEETVTPDILKEAADAVIQNRDMEQVFEQAKAAYKRDVPDEQEAAQ